MVYKFFDKKAGSEINVNKQRVEELHKPVVKQLKKRKVHAKFKENLWAADLTEMESLPLGNKNVN